MLKKDLYQRKEKRISTSLERINENNIQRDSTWIFSEKCQDYKKSMFSFIHMYLWIHFIYIPKSSNVSIIDFIL